MSQRNRAVESKDAKVWWTWAGERANATLAAAMPDVIDVDDLDNHYVRVRDDVSPQLLHAARRHATNVDLPPPAVTDEALQQLKFSEMLPPVLARQTLAARLSDAAGAKSLMTERLTWSRSTSGSL